MQNLLSFANRILIRILKVTGHIFYVNEENPMQIPLSKGRKQEAEVTSLGKGFGKEEAG